MTVLTVCHTNIRSILVSFNDLCCFVFTWQYDVTCLSKSWLDSSIANKDIFISGSKLPYRRGRNRHGGGVLVYVKKSLDCIRRADLEASVTEIMRLELFLRNNKHAFLAVCYQSPALNNDIQLLPR